MTQKEKKQIIEMYKRINKYAKQQIEKKNCSKLNKEYFTALILQQNKFLKEMK